jgi:hypothetical protein
MMSFEHDKFLLPFAKLSTSPYCTQDGMPRFINRDTAMLSIFSAVANTSKTKTSSQPFGLNARRIALERDRLANRKPDMLKLMQSLLRQLYWKP